MAVCTRTRLCLFLQFYNLTFEEYLINAIDSLILKLKNLRVLSEGLFLQTQFFYNMRVGSFIGMVVIKTRLVERGTQSHFSVILYMISVCL